MILNMQKKKKKTVFIRGIRDIEREEVVKANLDS